MKNSNSCNSCGSLQKKSVFAFIKCFKVHALIWHSTLSFFFFGGVLTLKKLCIPAVVYSVSNSSNKYVYIVFDARTSPKKIRIIQFSDAVENVPNKFTVSYSSKRFIRISVELSGFDILLLCGFSF